MRVCVCVCHRQQKKRKMSLLNRLLIKCDDELANELLRNDIFKTITRLREQGKHMGMAPVFVETLQYVLNSKRVPYDYKLERIMLWMHNNERFRNKLLHDETGDERRRMIQYKLEELMTLHCEGKKFDGTEYDTKNNGNAEEYKRSTGWLVHTFVNFYASL